MKKYAALMLVLVFGAAVGAGSIELVKRAGLGPFGTSQATIVAAGTNDRALLSTHERATAKLTHVCTCGVPASRRSLLLPVHHVAGGFSPPHSAEKPAGDCVLAKVSDAGNPQALLEAFNPQVELRNPLLNGLDPSDPDGANGLAIAAFVQPAADPYADAMPFATLPGHSYAGGGFGARYGLITSLPADESFGAPIAFAPNNLDGATASAAGTASGGTNSGGTSSGSALSATSGPLSSAPAVETPLVVATVPEPQPLWLLCVGLLAILCVRRSIILRN